MAMLCHLPSRLHTIEGDMTLLNSLNIALSFLKEGNFLPKEYLLVHEVQRLAIDLFMVLLQPLFCPVNDLSHGSFLLSFSAVIFEKLQDLVTSL